MLSIADPSLYNWVNCESSSDTLVRNIGYIANAVTNFAATPLYRCVDAGIYFTSTSSLCEGKLVDRLLGYIGQVPIDGAAPFISISNPFGASATATGVTQISTIVDDNGGIAKVEFYVDNALLYTDTTAPYTAAWDTTQYLNNSVHSVYTKAYDTTNNISTSSSIAVTVLIADTTPPVTAITSPVNNSTVPRNKVTVISATASDASGISKVEFYVGTTLKCTDVVAPYTCNWSVPAPKNVNYSLTAKAHDTFSNTKTSSVVNVKSSN